MRGRDAHVLGLRAAADDAEHAVAGLESGDVGAGALDDARELEPGDVGRDARRRRVEAGALHQIGAVQPGTVHPDEHLVGARLGTGAVGDDELRRPRP